MPIFIILGDLHEAINNIYSRRIYRIWPATGPSVGLIKAILGPSVSQKLRWHSLYVNKLDHISGFSTDVLMN